MQKKKLGIKRVDPETGKKFYDLNRDPIVSPYTNISYPISYFEDSPEKKLENVEQPNSENSKSNIEKLEDSNKSENLSKSILDKEFLQKEKVNQKTEQKKSLNKNF